MVAIVTGGSKGIGFAIARALLGREMQVTITGRSERDLQHAAASLQAGDKLHAVSADVRDEAAARRIVADTVARFGGVDILVNNAGVGRFANVVDMTAEAWREVIDTNLTGVFYCTHAALPELRRRGGGYIINISSLAGKNAFTGGAAYCASKAALNAFSEALMQEVRYDNIRVSYVMPGSVSTGFGDRRDSGQADPSTALGADWKLSPDDVAQAVVDLVAQDPRALVSRVEMRPSRPRKG